MLEEPFFARRPGLLVVLVAGLSYLWTLGLPFQLDDYSLIPTSGARLALIPGVLWDVITGGGLDSSGSSYMFRPVVWLGWLGLGKLGGGAPIPWVFHLAGVLVHVANSVLLLRILRKYFTPVAALVGTLVFAFHAAGSQAVSWVAAGGDLWMVFFLLAAWHQALAARESRSLKAAAFCGALLALGSLCKFTAFTALPAAGLVLMVSWRDLATRAYWKQIGVVGGLALVAFLVRWACMGTATPQYAGGMSFSVAQLPKMLGNLPHMLSQIVVPWNLNPEAADFEPWLAFGSANAAQAWIAALFLGFVLIGVGRGLSRFAAIEIKVLVACIPLVLPPLFLFTPDTHAVMSRGLYVLMMPFALVVASALEGLGRRTPRLAVVRKIGLGLFVLFLITSFDAVFHRAAIALHAGDLVDQRIASVESVFAEDGEARAVILVGDKPGFAGVPLIGASAFQPPYLDAKHVVATAHTVEAASRLPLLRSYMGELAILTGDAYGRLTENAEVLAAYTEADFRLELGAGGKWTSAVPIAGRWLEGIELAFEPGLKRDVFVQWKWAGSNVQTRPFTVPASTERTTLVCGFPGDPGRLMSPGLEWLGIGGEQPVALNGAPVCLASLPGQVELLSPIHGNALHLGEPLNFTFRADSNPEAARIRFRLNALTGTAGMAYSVPGELFEATDNGAYTWSPTPEQYRPSPVQGVSWSQLPAVLAKVLHDFQGPPIGQLEVSWQLELLTADKSWVQASSKWQTFFLRID